MLPSTLKYLYSVEPVRMHFPAKQPCTNDTVCNAACFGEKCLLTGSTESRYYKADGTIEKNVTCYNQRIVAIVDVLTSFIFIFTNDNR
jgi:hypothetical protein